MAFSSTLLASLLYALLFTAASALPSSKERLAARAARRANGKHYPNSANVSHPVYSLNWAGAIVTEGPPYGPWQSVTGAFAVPSVTIPEGQDQPGYWAASAWVGLDGYTCGNAILQTGLDFWVEDGGVYYDAWYQWFPYQAYSFEGITFSAGDIVVAKVYAMTPTSGYAQIENTSTGQTVSMDIGSEYYPLCLEDAEWIVEAFEAGGTRVNLADFGTVTFYQAHAQLRNTIQLPPTAGTTIDIYQDKLLTSVTTTSSTVRISYVG